MQFALNSKEFFFEYMPELIKEIVVEDNAKY